MKINFLPICLSLLLMLTTAIQFTGAQDGIVFADDFDRVSPKTVGNGWSQKGSVLVKNQAAFFQVDEEEFRPRMSYTFPIRKSGKLSVSFLLDWVRTNEGTWGFYMQLGNRAAMPRFLIRRQDLSKGMAINLLWGGGETVGGQKPGSLGYLLKEKFHPLVVLNDAKVPKSVVPNSIIRIDIDLDASSYELKLNGKSYNKIPFDNKVPIDTIRFVTDGCSVTGFQKSSIDKVVVKTVNKKR